MKIDYLINQKEKNIRMFCIKELKTTIAIAVATLFLNILNKKLQSHYKDFYQNAHEN